MVGAEGYEVETIKTFADTDNYEGYAFVAFENYGVKTQEFVVAVGEKVVEPYALDKGSVWMANGEVFDFETAITSDLIITATKEKYCTVTVQPVAGGESYSIEVKKGSLFDFSTLEKDGYVLTVIAENGEIVTSYTVESDCVLNVLYTK